MGNIYLSDTASADIVRNTVPFLTQNERLNLSEAFLAPNPNPQLTNGLWKMRRTVDQICKEVHEYYANES